METRGVLILAAIFLGIAAFSIFCFLFWIFMIVHCVKKEFANPNHKIAWIFALIFFHFFGALVYWFFVKRPDSWAKPV